MKSFLMTLITACLLTAAPITITYAQNFDKAVKAYEAGDYTTAAKEFRLLAEQGDAGAQNILGLMYDQGEGVTQDYVEAVRWHRLAAQQGDADAQNNLGYMYSKGQGVPQNYTEAVRWYQLSAKQGNASAQFNLGYRYSFGEGVPQDYVLAHMWFNIAAASGYENALKARDLHASLMTSNQIAEAQQHARDCMARGLKGC